MNLRRLKEQSIKYDIEYDFHGHMNMAGTNNEAVRIRNRILSAINPGLDPKYYNISKARNFIHKILNDELIVIRSNTAVHNKVMYVMWHHCDSPQQFCLRLYFNKITQK